MNVKGRGLLLSLVLLLPGAVAAQTATQRGADREQAPAGSKMYEDIEIFRRLLNDKVHEQYRPVQSPLFALANNCQNCHTTPMVHEVPTGNNGKNLAFDSAGNLFVSEVHRLLSAPTDGLKVWLSLDAPNVSCTRQRLLDTEGVYLKGQGVVYTLTLPPPPQKTQTEPAKLDPKPPSDWDRMRSEVRQEKAKPEGTKPAPKRESTLPEIMLNVLADNGRHFTQLAENESLIVVVTFRTPGPASTIAGSTANNTWWSTTGTTAMGKALGSSTATTLSSGSSGLAPDSSTQDYELLGDLHLKQGKGQEAITAYLKALEQKLEPKQAAKLRRKLAQAYLEEGKDAEAQVAPLQTLAELLVNYGDATKQSSPKPAETPRSPLPAKLILSAPKRLLDQVGTGQMSLEAFQKAVTVEYVNFPTGPK